MELTTPFQNLLQVLRNGASEEPSKLVTKINQCELDPLLDTALCCAVMGDNRPLNRWLFDQGMWPGQTIAWIAPIKAAHYKYVWMIGHQTKSAQLAHTWFADNRALIKEDPLLQQEQISPPLLFVDTVALSKVGKDDLGHDDEFAIFQTGYSDAPSEVSDLEQRMVINTSYAVEKRLSALNRLSSLVTEKNSDVLLCIRENIELFSILHNEGHNQGHFVGAWPHEDSVKKKCVMYEGVEEFRACLGAILLAEHLPMSELQKDAFAMSVFMSRFFGFGYDAFTLKSQRRETVREITVGLMFFEWYAKSGVIRMNDSGFEVDFKQLRFASRKAFAAIYVAEAAVSEYGQDALKQIALPWYQLAFPSKAYSPLAKKVYNSLGMKGVQHDLEKA